MGTERSTKYNLLIVFILALGLGAISGGVSYLLLEPVGAVAIMCTVFTTSFSAGMGVAGLMEQSKVVADAMGKSKIANQISNNIIDVMRESMYNLNESEEDKKSEPGKEESKEESKEINNKPIETKEQLKQI